MFKKNTVIKNEAGNDTLLNKVTVDEISKKSQIFVAPSDIAIIEKDGMLLDVLEEGIHVLYDKRNPLFASKNEESQMDIIFINKTVRTQILWGTPNYINILDPLHNVPINIGASGELEIQITNPRKFYLELVGRNQEFTSRDLKKRLTNKLFSRLEPSVAECLYTKQLSGENLLVCKNTIETQMEESLQTFFYKNYGIKLLSVSIAKLFLTTESLQQIQKAKQGITTEEVLEPIKIEEEITSETKQLIEDAHNKLIEQLKADIKKEEEQLEVVNELDIDPVEPSVNGKVETAEEEEETEEESDIEEDKIITMA